MQETGGLPRDGEARSASVVNNRLRGTELFGKPDCIFLQPSFNPVQFTKSN